MIVRIMNLLRFSRISALFCVPGEFLKSIDVGFVRLLKNYVVTIFRVNRLSCPRYQRNRTGLKFFEVVHSTQLSNESSRNVPTRYPRLNFRVRDNKTGKSL